MNEKLMFARVLNLDYLNSFDQNQLDLSDNDVSKNINNLVVSMEDGKVHLRWNDCVSSAWKKSYLVRAENSIPTSVYKGKIITSYTEKNKYNAIDLIDDSINDNVLYCYRVFSEFENEPNYYSGFKNIFYVYVASVTLCKEDHELGPILAEKIITDPQHRFVSDIQMLTWDNKSEFDGDYESLDNKPELARVALSGSYEDLLNIPSLATVAETGDYEDLINTPNIPSKTSELLNDREFATETFVMNKIAEAGFEDDDIDISHLATKEEVNLKADKTQLHNHENKSILDNITEELVEEWNNKSDFTGSYEDLTDTPEVYTKEEVDSLIENVTTNGCEFSGDYNDLTNTPELSDVALSGSYEDLTSKPDLYQKSELYNKTEVDSLIEEVIDLIPEKGGSEGPVQQSSTITRYVPEGAENGECYILATTPGVTFSKEGNRASLTVPKGTELLSVQVRFTGEEIGTNGKCMIKYGSDYNFTDNMCFPTWKVITDVSPNRVFKPSQACTLGDHPNEIEFTNMNANIGVVIKLTF